MPYYSGMDTKNICRVCKEPCDSYAELKNHFAVNHPQPFRQIEQWVDETTGAKIRSAEELAAQGMLGLKDVNSTLQHYESRNGRKRR